MKFISWNVNGLRACLKKGFLEFWQQEAPDFLCLQETKMEQGQAELSCQFCDKIYRFDRGELEEILRQC